MGSICDECGYRVHSGEKEDAGHPHLTREIEDYMVVYRPEHVGDFGGKSLFLAGPSHRGEYEGKSHWREEAIEILKDMDFDGAVFSPEPMVGSYPEQVAWEDRRLNESTVILFWVPRDLDLLPGFTTNVEFGEWMKSGKVVLGYPQEAPKMRYLHAKADKYGIPVAHTLTETLETAIELLRRTHDAERN